MYAVEFETRLEPGFIPMPSTYLTRCSNFVVSH
jgi:hypothetical protein